MLRDSVARAAAQARASTKAARLTAFAVEVDLDPEAALGAALQAGAARFFWDSRGHEIIRRECLLAAGEVGVANGAGARRFEEARARGAELLESVDVHGLGSGAAVDPSVRLFGAIAFDALDATLDGMWSELGDARFVLPRFLLAKAPGARSVLTVIASASELTDPEGLGVEAERVLHGAAPFATPPVARRRARVVDDGATVFERSLELALDAIRRGQLDKVVLARRSIVASALPADAVLTGLDDAASSTRFGVFGASSAFVGATPELLVTVDGMDVHTEAVAGSEPRSGDSDFVEAQRLLARPKDLWEHQLVAETIAGDLRAAGCEVDDVRGPRLRSLARVHHLVSSIRGRVTAPIHLLDLARALHPTAALGGAPRAAALEFVRKRERRGLYGGPVGYFDAVGGGAMVVAIRSALLGRDAAVVFAGAGIVRGSVPAAEMLETRAKEAVMLRALGAGSAEARSSLQAATLKQVPEETLS